MTRQRTEEERKQNILAAATRCFVRRGYTGTRLLDIAREAGLSKGGVYFHYRAKEHLFEDILNAHLDHVRQRWSFEPVMDQPADRTLVQLVEVQLRTLEAEPDETRLGNLLITLAPRSANIRRKLGQMSAAMVALYAAVIRRGMQEGVFRRGDPELLAHAVLAMMRGLAYETALDPQGKLPIGPEDAVECVLAMLRSLPVPRVGEFGPVLPSGQN
jgi:AcrR family transcriptional regulator